MKFKIEKIVTATIDTTIERKRIEEAFSDDPVVKKHLNKFMDLIEAGLWEDAKKELGKKFWRGSNAEYIGLLDYVSNDGFDYFLSYSDLINLVVGEKSITIEKYENRNL